MMLFAASPLFNEGEDHWEEAYQVNKQAVDELKKNGYELLLNVQTRLLLGRMTQLHFIS